MLMWAWRLNFFIETRIFWFFEAIWAFGWKTWLKGGLGEWKKQTKTMKNYYMIMAQQAEGWPCLKEPFANDQISHMLMKRGKYGMIWCFSNFTLLVEFAVFFVLGFNTKCCYILGFLKHFQVLKNSQCNSMYKSLN